MAYGTVVQHQPKESEFLTSCLSPPQYSTLKVGLSSGRQRRRSYILVVEISACPSHSCTLPISAPWAKALVAAVARKECTQNPRTSVVIPTSLPYRLTMSW